MDDIKISSILSEKAMVARLSTGGWSGRVTDKIATDELTETKGAKKGSTSVTKAIIDKKYFKAIREATSTMKKFHKENTMPWDNNGGRILPSSKFAAYNLELRECKRALYEATVAFIAGYPGYIIEAEETLGDLFNEADYPHVSEIEGRFILDTHFEKVPESGDFRVDIPEHEQTRIREQIENRVEGQHAQAMKRIWVRIFKAVEYMNQRLSEEDGVFRNSLVGNIQQLVDVLPSLNILEDPALADMTRELKERFCEYTPEDLRRNQVLRQEAVESTQVLMDKMTQMDDIFGTNSDQIIVDDQTTSLSAPEDNPITADSVEVRDTDEAVVTHNRYYSGTESN
jgi:hypothetical protein